MQNRITDLRESQGQKSENSTAANGHAGHADFTEKPRVDLRARRFAPCELRDSGVTNLECGWEYIPANRDCGWEEIYGGIACLYSGRQKSVSKSSPWLAEEFVCDDSSI